MSGNNLPRHNWKPKTWIVWSKHSTHGKKRSEIHRPRLKISAATCAIRRKDYQNTRSGIGLRFSRRSRRRQTPPTSTTIWRICARHRSVGRTRDLSNQGNRCDRIRPRVVSRAQCFPSFAQVGCGLCRHGEGEQTGRHRFGSEGMAAAVRTLQDFCRESKQLTRRSQNRLTTPSSCSIERIFSRSPPSAAGAG